MRSSIHGIFLLDYISWFIFRAFLKELFWYKTFIINYITLVESFMLSLIWITVIMFLKSNKVNFIYSVLVS